MSEQPEQPEQQYAWQPVSDQSARSIIGEGVHTGLRKGTEAPGAHQLWKAIQASDRAWSEALGFFVWGLDQMGYALCKKVPVEQPQQSQPEQPQDGPRHSEHRYCARRDCGHPQADHDLRQGRSDCSWPGCLCDSFEERR